MFDDNTWDFLRYKFVVAEALAEHINPIRLKIEDFLKNPDYLDRKSVV